MADFDAIGKSRTFSARRRGWTTSASAHEVDHQQQTARGTQETNLPQTSQARRLEQSTYARLNYDREDKEMMLELLDPQTGEILRKVPGKNLSEVTIRGVIGAVRANTKARP